MNVKKWYDYLWIATILYLTLGLINMLFAWLGLICFIVPLIISIVYGSKSYCNKYCGRGKLFEIIGGNLKLSRNKNIPKWIRSNWFRYGFLIFFMSMFFSMIFNTYLVFTHSKNFKSVITLLWTFKLPWKWTNTLNVSPWIANFAFGFYSVMITSTILGLITMVVFKPRYGVFIALWEQ